MFKAGPSDMASPDVIPTVATLITAESLTSVSPVTTSITGTTMSPVEKQSPVDGDEDSSRERKVVYLFTSSSKSLAIGNLASLFQTLQEITNSTRFHRRPSSVPKLMRFLLK
uniref:(northern house mosquito) hypothetical protein n=1 Tax=Culex pipiens TaxID=7175 RepID=A0A8D8NNT2_CULPI